MERDTEILLDTDRDKNIDLIGVGLGYPKIGCRPDIELAGIL